MADLTLAVPVKEAYLRLPLTHGQRHSVVDSMLQYVSSVAAEDVPDIVSFALRECQAGEHAIKVVKVC